MIDLFDGFIERAKDEWKGGFGNKEAKKRNVDRIRKELAERGIDTRGWSDNDVIAYQRDNP